ncbi:hypothetical protein AGLY_018338 [Aphis glycines]|uniref:Uncharacterized protein n=1 Tax=Aphis glycines TaxID=307491 RepID=A0A6G0ST49_APHGL|nr:hypothetical protein AGLY_018338 [Aphis glycines]
MYKVDCDDDNKTSQFYAKYSERMNDFERSDECIDFTMSITSRNNASISNFGRGFRWKSEYPWCIIEVKSKHFQTVFQNIEQNKKKSDGKMRIFTQNHCNSKTNHCKYLKISPNVYVSVVYIQLNFFDVNKKILNDQKFTFLRNLLKTRKFEILKYFISYLDWHFLHMNLNFGVFMPLKHKSPFSPINENYILG